MRPKSVSTNNSSSPKRSPDGVGTAFSHSPHTPGSVGGGGGGGNSSVAGGGNYAFNDALTVDSWSTTMTAMLQPHKSQRNTFQCPTHLSFTTKDPLDVCPHCERQQQLNLQERRRSVEKQLRDMDMTTNTTSVANDILQDLQSTVQQWKQPPAAPATPTSADGSHTTQSADNTNNNNNTQQQQQNLSRVNSGVSSNHSAGNTSASNNSAGGGSNHQTQAPPQAATPPLHPGSAPNSGGVPPAPPPNPMAATMQPPPPPMVPSFGATPMAGGAPGTTSGTPLEALALQIQGMQRMQDWMLYQKEQECQQLRQRLDAATQQINTLAVENALLQEKLNQQEQRMKHELKLIKLAALQQQQQRGSGGSGKSGSKNGDAASQSNHNNNNGPMVTAGPRGTASSSNVSVSSHHSGGSGGGANGSTADSGFGGMVLFPNADAMAAGGSSNNGGGAQPKTSVVTSALTHQDQSIFQASGNASTSTPQMNGGSGSGSGGFEPQSPAHVPSMGQISLNGPPDHQQQQGLVPTDTSGSADSGTEPQPPLVKKPEPIKQRDSSNASGPIDLDDMTEMIKASKAKGSLSPAQKSTPTTLPSSSEDDFSYQHIPRDIQIEPSLTGGTATDKKAAAQAQAPPDKSGTASADISKPWPDHVENPAPNVNFPDASDNMSVGNTVASSTYGEDRQQVTQQVILDPYGDRGTYTGVILRSTGMPHGSGRMIYQEDKRTYDGEWRHGRWHGYGRATFANGDHYHGEYRFDQRHGRGRYEWNDGRVYDGLFREDKRHGRGVFTWPDGAVYEGDFRNGQREGHGTYRFSDGGRYEGSWKDGRYNGFGICNWEDGRCYKGEWLNGMAHGKGVETFADGTVRHDGQWIEDEPVAS